MANKILQTKMEAALAALEAIDTAGPGEHISDVRLGKYNDDTQGFWFRVAFAATRTVGDDVFMKRDGRNHGSVDMTVKERDEMRARVLGWLIDEDEMRTRVLEGPIVHTVKDADAE